MQNLPRLTRRAGVVAAMGLMAPRLGATQPAPSAAPLSLLVGYAAGGSADLVSRAVGTGLSPRLRRAVVVENVAGASGMLAWQRLMATRADGSALYFGGLDTLVVPMINRNVRLNWRRDTIPVGRLTLGSLTFVVPAASPHRTMAEFLDAARRGQAEALSYGTPGVGTTQHFMGEAIGTAAGVRLLHAPYRGGTLIVNDLLGGTLDSAILVTSTALPPIRTGQLRPFAVSTEARIALLPEIPTLGELPGFGGVAFPLWQGLFARPGTPEPVLAAFDAAVADTLADRGIQQQLADAGFEAAPMPRTAFADFIASQGDVYERIVATANIRVE